MSVSNLKDKKRREARRKKSKYSSNDTVRLKIFDNQDMSLQDARYVPELENLLSISMFDVVGLTIKIEHDTIKILKGVFIVVSLYILDALIVIAHASLASQTKL